MTKQQRIIRAIVCLSFTLQVIGAVLFMSKGYMLENIMKFALAILFMIWVEVNSLSLNQTNTGGKR